MSQRYHVGGNTFSSYSSANQYKQFYKLPNHQIYTTSSWSYSKNKTKFNDDYYYNKKRKQAQAKSDKLQQTVQPPKRSEQQVTLPLLPKTCCYCGEPKLDLHSCRRCPDCYLILYKSGNHACNTCRLCGQVTRIAWGGALHYPHKCRCYVNQPSQPIVVVKLKWWQRLLANCCCQ